MTPTEVKTVGSMVLVTALALLFVPSSADWPLAAVSITGIIIVVSNSIGRGRP